MSKEEFNVFKPSIKPPTPIIMSTCKQDIAEIIGYEPTEEQRDIWLLSYAHKNNCHIASASEIPELKQYKSSLIMKVEGQKKYHGGIYFGKNNDERRWYMLLDFIVYKRIDPKSP